MNSVTHKFVDCIPVSLEDGVVYVSVVFGTAVHRCCCGCGREVVTPLTPTDWKLIFDGETVSLHPSIGNWSFSCRSHYWIRRNRVEWAENWPAWKVEAAAEKDRREKDDFYLRSASIPDSVKLSAEDTKDKKKGFWSRFWK